MVIFCSFKFCKVSILIINYLTENTINALKRKAQNVEENAPKKLILNESVENTTSIETNANKILVTTEKAIRPETVQTLNVEKPNVNLEKNLESEKSKSPTRRASHESTATSTATSTSSSSSSSSSDSSNSSSSDDSDSSGDNENKVITYIIKIVYIF